MKSPTAKQLNKERGSDYGPPLDEFSCEQEIMELWIQRRIGALFSGSAKQLPRKQELALRQAVSMCVLKLVRAAQSPTKRDHWDDVGGYARTALMILGVEK